MITVFKKFDKMYGGYDYIEVDHLNNTHREGNSRSHRGHMKGQSLHVEVSTKKELKKIKTTLVEVNGSIEVE